MSRRRKLLSKTTITPPFLLLWPQILDPVLASHCLLGRELSSTTASWMKAIKPSERKSWISLQPVFYDWTPPFKGNHGPYSSKLNREHSPTCMNSCYCHRKQVMQNGASLLKMFANKHFHNPWNRGEFKRLSSQKSRICTLNLSSCLVSTRFKEEPKL